MATKKRKLKPTEIDAMFQPTIAEKPPEEPTRKVAYVLSDPIIIEGFEVYDSPKAWWMEKEKILKLVNAFKYGMNVKEACVYALISYDQYNYFNHIHPKFSELKSRCLQTVGGAAKIVVGEAIKEDANLAFKYLQGTQPEVYKRKTPDVLPEGASASMSYSEEAFLNDEGEVIMKRRTAEYLEKKDGDTN